MHYEEIVITNYHYFYKHTTCSNPISLRFLKLELRQMVSTRGHLLAISDCLSDCKFCGKLRSVERPAKSGNKLG